MNCPLCDTPLDEQGVCPNCGEEKSPTTLPGIYYENLAEIQEELDVQAQAPRKEPFFSPGEKRCIAGCFLLLVLFIGTIWAVSRSYDPAAQAISGKHGVSMDNRTFSIYCRGVMEQASSQSEALPFDPSRPLSKQYYNLDAGYTWEDYFMSQAFSTAALTEVLVNAAEAEGFTLSQVEADALMAELSAMEESGKASYGDSDRYAQATFGSGVTWDTYRQYRLDSALAQAYTNAKHAGFLFSEAELSDYYDQHSGNYADTPKSSLPNVDIRHILFLPERDTPEADDAARQNAEDAYAQCQSGGEDERESIFLQLVPEYSQDSGSNGTGGLLENISPGAISAAISDWCFDPAGRTPGDMAVLPSGYGYHVVYFVGYRDNFAWKDTVLQDMRTAALRTEFSLLMEEADCKLTPFAAID